MWICKYSRLNQPPCLSFKLSAQHRYTPKCSAHTSWISRRCVTRNCLLIPKEQRQHKAPRMRMACISFTHCQSQYGIASTKCRWENEYCSMGKRVAGFKSCNMAQGARIEVRRHKKKPRTYWHWISPLCVSWNRWHIYRPSAKLPVVLITAWLAETQPLNLFLWRGKLTMMKSSQFCGSQSNELEVA